MWLENTSQCYEISHRCSIFGLSYQTRCFYSVVPLHSSYLLLSSWVLIKIGNGVEIGFLDISFSLYLYTQSVKINKDTLKSQSYLYTAILDQLKFQVSRMYGKISKEEIILRQTVPMIGIDFLLKCYWQILCIHVSVFYQEISPCFYQDFKMKYKYSSLS